MGAEQEFIESPQAAREAWYIVAQSKDVRKRPRRVHLFREPWVLFRTSSGELGALSDRCPHRNVPLSLGSVRQGRLVCRYHGWAFDAQGTCKEIPSLGQDPPHEKCNALSTSVREQDGFIWLWGQSSRAPSGSPFAFPREGESYTTVRYQGLLRSTVGDAAENALDVPHTAYLHGGLFRRKTTRSAVEVVTRRWENRVEAQYLGEGRPAGVVGRLLAPEGGTVEHWDRFFLPSIAQVEYKLAKHHLLITTAFTPMRAGETGMFSALTFRLPVPPWMAVPAVKPIVAWILRQDARVLQEQQQTICRFGERAYVSTEADVLGPHITALLRQATGATQGRHSEGAPRERRISLLL